MDNLLSLRGVGWSDPSLLLWPPPQPHAAHAPVRV